MFRPVSEAAFSDAELERAVGRLTEGDALRAAEARVAAAAPALQLVLARALEAGGWVGEPHRSEIARLIAIDDDVERARALEVLLTEETRIAMLVGVAAGWALAAELGAPTNHDREES
jgi:hypothetical protein